MTVVTAEIDLEKTFIVFGPENGEKIYYGEGLSSHDNKDLVNKYLGHDVKKTSAAAAIVMRLRGEGKFKASEVKEMCINFKKDPREIRSKYSSKIIEYIFRGGGIGTVMEIVSDRNEEAIWKAICDVYDNKS